jgi:hypothetical protein
VVAYGGRGYHKLYQGCDLGVHAMSRWTGRANMILKYINSTCAKSAVFLIQPGDSQKQPKSGICGHFWLRHQLQEKQSRQAENFKTTQSVKNIPSCVAWCVSALPVVWFSIIPKYRLG